MSTTCSESFVREVSLLIPLNYTSDPKTKDLRHNRRSIFRQGEGSFVLNDRLTAVFSVNEEQTSFPKNKISIENPFLFPKTSLRMTEEPTMFTFVCLKLKEALKAPHFKDLRQFSLRCYQTRATSSKRPLVMPRREISTFPDDELCCANCAETEEERVMHVLIQG